MQGKIAIEPNLTPVKKYLTSKGYEVENIDFSQNYRHDPLMYKAFVVTGLNSNRLGVNDKMSNAKVINADGMTPEQVAAELERMR